MDFTVIVTLGPSILNEEMLRKIAAVGPCIFRINGAHVTPDLAPRLIQQVRMQAPAVPIMIDLPGNKIRTCNLTDPVRLVTTERLSAAVTDMHVAK